MADSLLDLAGVPGGVATQGGSGLLYNGGDEKIMGMTPAPGGPEPQFYSLLPPYSWPGQSLIGGRDAPAGTQSFFPAQGGPPPMTINPFDRPPPPKGPDDDRLYRGGAEGVDWRKYMGNPSTRGGFFTIRDLVNTNSPLINGLPLNAVQAQWDSPSTNNWRLIGNNPNMIMRSGFLIDRSKQLDQPIPVWHGGANPDAGGGTYGRGYGGHVGYPAFTSADFGSGWGYWPGAYARADFPGAVT